MLYPNGVPAPRRRAPPRRPSRDRRPVDRSTREPPTGARRSARGGDVQALPTLRSPQGPVVEMEGRGEVLVLSSNNYLGLAARPGGGRGRHRGARAATAPARRRCASSAARSSRTSSSRRELADLVGTEAALTYVSCWNANEAVIPTPDGRAHGDPLGRAQPREHRRRDAAREAGAQGDLRALRHGRAARRASRPASRRAQARRHGRRLQHGRRPRPPARDRRARARCTTPS